MRGKTGKVIGIVLAVVLVVLAVGAVGMLSGGFKDWNVKTWFSTYETPKDYFCGYADDNGILGASNPGVESGKYVLLPTECHGVTIHTLGNALKGNTEIVGVKIPEGYTKVNTYALSGCSSLRKVYVPASVVTFGDLVFSQCKDLTIYCAAAEKPAGWHEYWNRDVVNVKVVWGYKG